MCYLFINVIIIKCNYKCISKHKIGRIDPLHDDVKNQNKPGALCIVGFIGGPLSDNTVIITPF